MSDQTEKASVEHRLTSIEEKHSAQTRRFGERLDAHDKNFEKLNGKIEDIVKMLSTRPTWLVTWLLTCMTTVTSGLIMYVLTHK